MPQGRGRTGRHRAGGGPADLGVKGVGGDEVPDVGVDVVEVSVVVVVVLAVVRWHLWDAGGDAPHRLDVRLRGCPALCPSTYILTVPPGPHAPPLHVPGGLCRPSPPCPWIPSRPKNPWFGRTPAPLPSGPCS